MKLSNLLFFNSLVIGTLISISAISWFSMWIGLELNLLSFIPLMNEKKINSSEASLKYFIVQVIASMFILFSFMLILNYNDFLNFNYFSTLLLNSALLTKMGAAPFHFWFPEIMEGINWVNSLILLTWQKIAPMVLLMYSIKPTMFFFIIILSCMLISGLKNWNQTSMKKIMTFSSINHIGWMIPLLFLNQSIWMFYFLIYSFLTMGLILIFKIFNIQYLKDLSVIFSENKNFKLYFFLNFFSLGGIPPFLGFLPKWITLMILLEKNYLILSFFMVILTLITLFVYIRLSIQALTLNFFNFKTFKLTSNLYLTSIINFFNLNGLILLTILFNYF